MSEEQLVFQLEMYFIYFCHNICIKQPTCLSAINIIFFKVCVPISQEVSLKISQYDLLCYTFCFIILIS